ncbi:UNVERIFIED_CONTAM: hypothetical protein Scaly_3030500 [Sesamum calycinum]|uniref:Reverse transcriptase domain-containing protein n=1 Tax=Sesamum calycinum TaxID=2727403 RepID=A0AAW2K9I8_9LAMI
MLRGECSNRKQRNNPLSEMNIIEIQATLEASEIEAQDIQESSDKEETVTPIFNRFQSPEDSDPLLDLDPELQVIPNSTDSTPGNYMHDQVISNRLKRNNSMEDHSVKIGKAAGKGKKNKDSAYVDYAPNFQNNPRVPLSRDMRMSLQLSRISLGAPLCLEASLQHLSSSSLRMTLPNLGSGFVPGRLIANNILFAQEMTHHLDMRHSKGNLILKLDMYKAYDRVKWKFLYAILEKMGFPARFITLIKRAIEHC